MPTHDDWPVDVTAPRQCRALQESVDILSSTEAINTVLQEEPPPTACIVLSLYLATPPSLRAV